MGRLIGYAMGSTPEQSLDLQLDERKIRMKTKKGDLWVIWIVIIIFGMFSCGGGGGGGGLSDPGDTVEEGVFLDAAVQGLTYQTPTQSGETDDEGTFEYSESTPPENVTFSVGTLVIGSAPGQATITPVDLVPGATGPTDPTVTNISIFLLGLDEDGDPSNGILISNDIADIVSQYDIDFNQSTDDFLSDQNTQDLLNGLNNAGVFTGSIPRVWPSAADAQIHLAGTLADIDGGDGDGGDGGDGDGGDGGIYSVGGTVTGLTTILALQNNGGDDLPVADESFVFGTKLNDGDDYNVTVFKQPLGQTCTVENGTGTISGADVTDVIVTCVDNSEGSSGSLTFSGPGASSLPITTYTPTDVESDPMAGIVWDNESDGASTHIIVAVWPDPSNPSNAINVSVNFTANDLVWASIGPSVPGVTISDDAITFNNTELTTISDAGPLTLNGTLGY